ncbi:MAG: efflux RND transporter periplasmic adaptor subunit [Pseudomonadota bacterium]
MNTMDSKPRHPKTIVALWVGLILVAFLAGYYFSQAPTTPETSVEIGAQPTINEAQGHFIDKKSNHDHESTVWTCAMHPQIRMPNAGKCPICFMDLIPLETGGSDSKDTRGASTLSMSETARKLAEIQTTEVRRERAKALIHMVGMVFEAETRQAVITSRIEGRLDEVYVNFTGESVNKGDPLVKIWSPTLIKGQVELFETIKSDPDDQSVIKGAEEKLIQYGLDREQIDQIRVQKRPTLYVTLKAPITGIVTKKNAILGQFVKEGTEMFVINDLSDVWVKMDAYETDLPWIRYGQNITFTTSAVPGKTFHGKVLFIDPTLDTKTRSVKVRVDAPNPDYLLKPGMFVSAELEAELDDHGKVIKPEWAGKYICPVHPRDEASDIPGVCPDSKMPLRPASSYGYADDKGSRAPLLIPITAPLITGKRAIVYIEVPGTSTPTYELREVILGSRVGNQYIVDNGLREGERVVTKGAFKIDSTMQILGKTSMMAPAEKKSPDDQKTDDKSDEDTIEKLVAPKSFIARLTPIFVEYIKLKNAIGTENSEAAVAASSELTNSIKKIDTSALDLKQKKKWNQLSNGLLSTTTKIANNKTPIDQRRFFNSLSETTVKILMTFGQMTQADLTIFHCPKAFDGSGAYWIGQADDRKNPFHKITPENDQEPDECAEIVEKIAPENP